MTGVSSMGSGLESLSGVLFIGSKTVICLFIFILSAENVCVARRGAVTSPVGGVEPRGGGECPTWAGLLFRGGTGVWQRPRGPGSADWAEV